MLTPGQVPKPVAVGEWLWACRAGSEPDLCDELLTFGITGRALQPALCASPSRPRNQQKEDVELTFARQGLPVQAVGTADAQVLARQIAEFTEERRFTPQKSGLALHVFAPDSDSGNMLAATVLALQARLTEALLALDIELLPDGKIAHTEGGRLIQVCLLGENQVALGVLPARAAPSLFPGGRQRYKKPKDAPARSALKLTEALAWLGHGPQAGEVCVDLGAAPGGWSQVLLDRECHVVAIDPGRIAPHLVGRLEHLKMNAFSFEPEVPADWVLCDMAYRPLEVAGLLAKWGRRRWAQFLLANIKLPMSRRVDMLARVKEILATGGWTGLRMRQLYHDRDEVTLSAWRGFGIDTRVPQRRAAAGGPASDFERPAHADRASGRAPARKRPPSRHDESERPAHGDRAPARKRPASRHGESERPAHGDRAPARKRPANRHGESERPAHGDRAPGRAPARKRPTSRHGESERSPHRAPPHKRPVGRQDESERPARAPSRAPARKSPGTAKAPGRRPSAPSRKSPRPRR
jgi:23S rRNA (cytidine2498-2'-O)-methyltransferase